jgi:YbbR domain-containing protein
MIAFLRNLFLKDFWLKLFSLAVALMIWSIVHNATGSGNPFRSTTVKQRPFPGLPVVVLSSAENVLRFRIDPKEVKVTVQAESRLLKELKPENIRVTVDLTGIESANNLRKRVEVSVPAGVTVVDVQPPEVDAIFPP